MEEQFILRVPEPLKDKIARRIRKGELDDISIKMISSKEGVLMFEGKTYNGKLMDLPCIIESHKTLDNRQFIKVCDISKILVFYEDTPPAKKELEDIPLSGLTPPMKYVKIRRFRKRLTKAPIVEEIEKAVSRLLEKDQEALHVEVQLSNKHDESDDDVSSLAAEIELNLLESEKASQTAVATDSETNLLLQEKEELLKEIITRIGEKQSQLKEVTNLIVRKRFEEALAVLEQEKKSIEDSISEIRRNLPN